MLSGFIVMNKISARFFFFFRGGGSFSQLEEAECECGKKMKIGFVVELFMLMRGSEFGAGHLT